MLSRVLIDALRAEIGEEKTKELFTKIGHEMGEKVVRQLELENNVSTWTADEYQDFFIEKYLQEAGAEPEVVAKTDNSVTYRIHNCIFFEISQKIPGLMCDVLHKHFHDGIISAMGRNIKDMQNTCMGHGDQYCEHVIHWAD